MFSFFSTNESALNLLTHRLSTNQEPFLSNAHLFGFLLHFYTTDLVCQIVNVVFNLNLKIDGSFDLTDVFLGSILSTTLRSSPTSSQNHTSAGFTHLR